MTKHVMTVFGTRPEAIKMAPVVLALQSSEDFKTSVCVTAQHREMLDQVLDIFGITPDIDLNLMAPRQDLFDITAKVILGMRDVLRTHKPDVVLVHGDTTTCFAAGLAAFYEKIPLGHVEAGLRTGDMHAPFPEEANRSLVGRIASYHFAPTQKAYDNLIAENVAKSAISITGNTVIDALHIVSKKLENIEAEYWKSLFGNDLFSRISDNSRKFVLITGHRRENFGQGFLDLCTAIKSLADQNENWDFIYPVHLNPNVQKPVYEILSANDNVALIPPQEYLPFVWLMNNCDLVLTDSGGIQEEAPSLGKPVLVMRDVTERPEAVDAGCVQLVGTNTDKIINSVTRLLSEHEVYSKMATAINPYGDGLAANRILEILASSHSS